jgi:hypothetical protein
MENLTHDLCLRAAGSRHGVKDTLAKKAVRMTYVPQLPRGAKPEDTARPGASIQ